MPPPVSSTVDITTYLVITISYANVFIALFIAVYAWLFLKKTNEHRDRRPWDFLFIASILYLIFQVFNIFYGNGLTTLLGSTFNVELTRNIFSFLYSGCVLLAFISQHDLILRSELILISKKEPKDEKKKEAVPEQTTSSPTASATVQNNKDLLKPDVKKKKMHLTK
jgi:hypothetical protein